MNDYALEDPIPPKPGTGYVPPGRVRLFHVSSVRRAQGDERPWHEVVHERAQALRDKGIDVSHARGESYGEPNVVWGAAGKPITDFNEAVVVEFHHAPHELDIGGTMGRPDLDRDTAKAASLERNHSHVTLFPGQSVSPKNIIGVHEPWHAHYRYMKDDPTVLADVKSGMHDNLIEDEPVGYGPAIRRIKAESSMPMSDAGSAQ